MHRSIESDFRFDVTLSGCWPERHFAQKNAATWRVHVKHLSSAGCLCSSIHYTVGHKKGATLIFTITLANVDRFQ